MKDSSPSKDELREMAAAYRPSSGMELPQGATFNSRPLQLSPTEYVRWCEEVMRLGHVSMEPAPSRCVAEFKL